MKGEYTENQDHHHHHNNPHHNHNAHHSIFSKFQPPHLHSQPQPPKFQPNLNPHPHYNPFPLTTTTTLKDSEEADSAATTTTPQPPSKKSKTSNTATTTTSEDGGGTIEVARRPRGRPPGSKNKPKPPIVITREPEPAMAPYILEVPGGSDIVDSLTRFTRRRGIGLCVLTASGAVANVSLKQPSTSAPAGTVTFHGRFDILSLSAALLLQTVPLSSNNNSGGSGNSNNGSGNSNNAGYGFTISLAGPQGQIVGGKVVGPLLAAGTVYIIAASFCSPSYHRLPLDQDHHDHHQQQQHFHNQNQNPSSVSVGGERQSSSPVSGGGGGGESSGGGNGGGASGPMGMYSCHMGSDVIWAPTARHF